MKTGSKRIEGEGLTNEKLTTFIEKQIKAIEKSNKEYDMYWTRCKKCRRRVLAVAFLEVEECPMCTLG